MSHQTGIQASDELKAALSHAKNGADRLLKMTITNETISLEKKLRAVSTWDKDFQTMIPNSVEDNQACYILFRMDTKNSLGYDWIFVTYTPDASPVRQRMLYAATRATLKTEFGQVYLKEDVQASSRNDLTVEAFQVNRNVAPVAYSMVEAALLNAKITENNPDELRSIVVNQTLKGVAFPVDQEALEKLQMFKNEEFNYVQLSVDTLNEAIKLEKFENIRPQEFQSNVPRQKARYHFYRFEHDFEGETIRPVLFIYTLPPSGHCPVKDKMLYSSCKAPFLDNVQRQLGIQIDRKLEVDSSDDINESFLFDELHPKQIANQTSFAKPKGPKNQRGVRRLNKVEGENGE